MSVVQLSKDNLSIYAQSFISLGADHTKQKIKSFLDNAQWTIESYWIYVEEGKVLGRIGAYLPSRDSEATHIGFFEVNLKHDGFQEVAKYLYNKAIDWGIENGRTKSWAPINKTTYHDYRYRVDAEDDNHFWEPQNPKEYVDILINQGFEVAENYTSFFWNNYDGCLAAALKSKPLIEKEGFTFKNIDLKNKFNHEAELMYELNTKIYAESFKIDNISLDNFVNLMIKPLSNIDLSYSFYICNKDAAEVGFIFCICDQGRIVIKSLSVLPDYQGKHLGSALMYKSLGTAKENGILKFGAALMQTKTKSHQFVPKNEAPTHLHKYQLFSKDNK
jgi:GNAT superfamily N-acetyltransferase